MKQENKTKIELWDITEENKLIYSFELEDNETQKLSIHKNNNPRDSIFIDISKDMVKVITEKGVFETII